MPQSRVQAIVAGRRGITADTAIRLAAFLVTRRSSGLIVRLPMNGHGRLHW